MDFKRQVSGAHTTTTYAESCLFESATDVAVILYLPGIEGAWKVVVVPRTGLTDPPLSAVQSTSRLGLPAPTVTSAVSVADELTTVTASAT